MLHPITHAVPGMELSIVKANWHGSFLNVCLQERDYVKKINYQPGRNIRYGNEQ